MVDLIKAYTSNFLRLFTSTRMYNNIKKDKTYEFELEIGSGGTHKSLFFFIDFSRVPIALIQMIHQLLLFSHAYTFALRCLLFITRCFFVSRFVLFYTLEKSPTQHRNTFIVTHIINTSYRSV